MTIKTTILINELRQGAALQPQHVLTNWAESIERLHLGFDQLNACVTKLIAESNTRVYTGLCPITQLFQLLKDMNRQLTQLLERADDLPNLTSLSAHTVLINALATRAAVVIQLFNWSAS